MGQRRCPCQGLCKAGSACWQGGESRRGSQLGRIRTTRMNLCSGHAVMSWVSPGAKHLHIHQQRRQLSLCSRCSALERQWDQAAVWAGRTLNPHRSRVHVGSSEAWQHPALLHSLPLEVSWSKQSPNASSSQPLPR